MEELKQNSFHQAEIVDKLTQSAEKLREDAQNRAEREYQTAVNKFDIELETHKKNVESDFQAYRKKLDIELKDAKDRLEDLRRKQEAYVLAQQRQEAIAADASFYSLSLDKTALGDVELLRDLQPRFVQKDAIDKIIWENYYRPAYDTLMSHLFTSTEKVSGIYKITDQTTGAAYIGQSVDIRERMRQHIKSGLAYKPASNKLYQAMQKNGPENFIFEILEEVPKDKLNEREIYWIDFYKTRDRGLNITKGGS